MEWVVTTGKTEDEAKEQALDQLGVDALDAEFEVLEEPKPGLFGRMRGEYKVRARVRPTAARPKVERRKRRGKADGKGDDAETEATTEAVEKPARAPRAAKAPKAAAADTADGAEPKAERTRSAAPRAPRATSNRSNGKVAATSDDGKDTAMSESASERDDQDLPSVEAAATSFLQGLTGAFGLAAEVSVVTVDGDDDELEARVEGADLGVLIGPAGQTLTSIQELTRLAVQQQRGGVRGGWLRVDVAGYRVKRREALERFATQIVDQVKESGTAKALEPMNAADRKVVHDTATRLGGVSTSSEGEEPRRRVVIRPA